MAETQSAQSIAYSRAPLSTWVGIVCLFVLFGIIVLAVIGPSPRTSDYEQARAKKRMEKLKALHEENQKELTTYAWVDKNKGAARIPIDRAMQLTVAELAQKKSAPAGPIATPAAQTAPGGASPAPAASQQAATAQPAQPNASAGPSTAPATSQQPRAAQQGAISNSPSPVAASPAPATQPSPQGPTSPAPASTP